VVREKERVVTGALSRLEGFGSPMTLHSHEDVRASRLLGAPLRWFVPLASPEGSFRLRSFGGGHVRRNSPTLVVHRRKRTAERTKSGGTSSTAKGIGHLLGNVGAAKIPLGLLLRKRNPQVVASSQNVIGTRQESVQKLLGRPLFCLALRLFCARGKRWLGGRALSQHCKGASDPFVPLEGGNRGATGAAPLLAGVMQIEQAIVPLCRPRVMLSLGNGGTISQQRCSTDAVSTVLANRSGMPRPQKCGQLFLSFRASQPREGCYATEVSQRVPLIGSQ
jgi:hypothetical protein